MATQITSAMGALSGMSKVAVAATAAAVCVGFWGMGPIVSAVMTPGPPVAASEIEPEETAKAQAERLALAQKMIDGRSLFVPPQPPRPTRPTEEEEPRIPTRYEGPPLVGFLGETAIFAPSGGDGVFLRPGMTAQGVKLIAIDAPWTARVAYGGGEYTVNLFDEIQFASNGGGEAPVFGTRPGIVAPGARGDRGGARFEEMRRRIEDLRRRRGEDGVMTFQVPGGGEGEFQLQFGPTGDD